MQIPNHYVMGALDSSGVLLSAQIDAHGLFKQTSAGFRKWLGADSCYNIFDHIFNADYSKFLDCVKLVNASGDPESCVVRFVALSESDYLFMPCRVVISPEGVRHVSFNILVMPQAAPTVLKASDIQSHKLMNIGSLTAGVVHDLNNLLTGMMAYADLLSDTANQVEYITQLKTGLEEATRLTGSIMSFLREDGSTEPINPSACVGELLHMLKKAMGKTLVLHLSLDACEHQVALKRSDLAQILCNLLVNAKDAVAGKGTVKVRCSEKLVEGQPIFVLEVEDDGSGIDSSVLPFIFDPFFTTKESKGVGLGLSIVSRLVQSAKGHIHVDSKPGCTIFKITLPTLAEDVS